MSEFRACLSCHAAEATHPDRVLDTHQAAAVACVNCHSVRAPAESDNLLFSSTNELGSGCHPAAEREAFSRPRDREHTGRFMASFRPHSLTEFDLEREGFSCLPTDPRTASAPDQPASITLGHGSRWSLMSDILAWGLELVCVSKPRSVGGKLPKTPGLDGNPVSFLKSGWNVTCWHGS